MRRSLLQIAIFSCIDSIVLERMSGLVICNIVVSPHSSSNVSFHESLLRRTWRALRKRICCAR